MTLELQIMCWDEKCFDLSTYERFASIRVIQEAGGTLSVTGIGDVHTPNRTSS